MTATGSARADVDALDRLVATGAAVRVAHEIEAAMLRELGDVVRAGCGPRAAPGDAAEAFERMMAGAAETERFVEQIAAEVRAADATPSLTTPAWVDPDSDSWVIGIARMGSGSRPSPIFTRRVAAEGPELLRAVTDPELSTVNQAQLLLSDPARFVANWRRAGRGAVDAGTSTLGALAGLGALIAPGADEVAAAALDRQPAAETHRSIAEGLRALAMDPDTAVESAIGSDVFVDDPYRWLGALAPDVVLEGASAAVPFTVVRRAVSVVPPASPIRVVPAPVVDGGFGGRWPVAAGPPAGSSPGPAGPFPDLIDFRRTEPEWGPAEPITSHRQGPHESPEGWATELNGPGADAPGRDTNCIDCARATEANWRGQDAVAAPVADAQLPGVSPDRLEDWTGGRLVPASIDDIGERLDELGPGSSAIITSGWDTGGAHAYNAVNDAGTIKWVDGQLGQVSTWPPPYAVDVEMSIVIFVDPNGHPL